MPKLRVALNHICLPEFQKLRKDWDFRDGMQLLAKLPNVYLKISSFGEIPMDEIKGTSQEIIDYTVEMIKLFTP